MWKSILGNNALNYPLGIVLVAFAICKPTNDWAADAIISGELVSSISDKVNCR
jgi:hypothetical protein